MPSTIVCPQCGLKMRVYRGAGTRIDCPSCRKSLKIVRPERTRASAAKNQDPPSTHDWYYRVMGVEVGPLSLEALRRDFRAKKLGPDAQVRMGTRGRWVLAETVRDLQIDRRGEST